MSWSVCRHLALSAFVSAAVLVAFSRSSADENTLGKEPAASQVDLEDSTLAERRKYVNSLTAERQYDLMQKRRRFDQLPDVEKQRIRTLHQQIQQADDKDQLKAVLERYTEWLGR